MTIHTIVNKIRRGKTLTLTFLTGLQAWRGTKIYSNYYTIFNNVLVNSLTELDTMRKGWFAWDDAYIWANSRRKDLKGVDLILGKSGKRGIDIAWTTTRTNQVDINIRENTEFIWWPQLIRNNEFCVIRQFLYYPERGDSDEERTGEPVRTMMFRTKPVFDWYDTREEVESIEGVN